MDQLTAIADQVDALLPQFSGSSALGISLPSKASAEFKGLLLDAKDLIQGSLGFFNDYNSLLSSISARGDQMHLGGISYADVQEAASIIRAAQKAVTRREPPAWDFTAPPDNNAEELRRIATELRKWSNFASTLANGDLGGIPKDEQPAIRVLLVEARGYLNDRLTRNNEFTPSFQGLWLDSRSNTRSPSSNELEELALLLEAAAKRPLRIPLMDMSDQQIEHQTNREVNYVSEQRLSELANLRHPSLDLKRLIALCREINVCYNTQATMAVALLVRAVLDHIPPLFGFATFEEVVSNYSGGSSFKNICSTFKTPPAESPRESCIVAWVRKKLSLTTRQ